MKADIEGRRRVGRVAVAVIAAAALAALAAPAAHAVTANYGFDTGDQGWRSAQTNAGPFEVPTFNPAGFISDTDTGAETGCPGSPCDIFYFSSPGMNAPMSANYGGALSFDFATSAPPDFLAVAYIDSAVDTNPELRQRFTPSSSGFGRVTLPLTEAGWFYCPATSTECAPATQQQFRSVLATAVYTDLLADVVDGTGETYSLDNVSVTEPPAAPPPKKAKKCKRKKGKKGAAAAAKKKKCKKKGGTKRSRAAVPSGLARNG